MENTSCVNNDQWWYRKYKWPNQVLTFKSDDTAGAGSSKGSCK